MFKKLLFAFLFLSIGTIYGQDAPVQVDPHAPVGDVVNPNPTTDVTPTGPGTLTNDPHVKVDPNANPSAPQPVPNTEPKSEPIPGVNPNEGQVIDPNPTPAPPAPPVPNTAPEPIH